MTLAVSKSVYTAITMILVFLAVVVIAGAGVLLLRRRMLLKQCGAGQGAFSVEKLQELRRSGRISEEEFSHLRRSLLGLAGGSVEKDSSSSRGTTGHDDEEDGKDGEEGPCDHRE